MGAPGAPLGALGPSRVLFSESAETSQNVQRIAPSIQDVIPDQGYRRVNSYHCPEARIKVLLVSARSVRSASCASSAPTFPTPLPRGLMEE